MAKGTVIIDNSQPVTTEYLVFALFGKPLSVLEKEIKINKNGEWDHVYEKESPKGSMDKQKGSGRNETM